MEQLLETGLMALKPLPLLRRLERERRVRRPARQRGRVARRRVAGH